SHRLWTNKQTWPLTPSGRACYCNPRGAQVMQETALRETIERLELALQAAQAGLFDRNLQTHDITFSAQQYKTFGLEPGSRVTYDIFRQSLHPDDRDRVEKIGQQTIEQRTDMAIEFRIVRPDGEVRWLASRGRPFYDAEGKPAR